MEYDFDSIGRRIREERKKLKKTDKEMAQTTSHRPSEKVTLDVMTERLHINRNNYCDLEQGMIGNIKLSTMFDLADMFGVSVGYLLGEYDSPTKEIEDIHEVTGLSANVIQSLIEMKEEHNLI